jgi:hypothetical protein
MAKSPIEKALEKQQKEAKKLAEKEARQRTASAIVNGQPSIGGMRIMDEAAEEILKIILSVYDGNDNRQVHGSIDIIPKPYQISLQLEFDKLAMYGVITSPCVWITAMWEATLTPQGITYFEAKTEALKRHDEEQKQQTFGSITNYGNLVFGDVSGSTLTVDNSIHQIERMIDEKGGEDKEELLELLEEVKELLENIQTSRSIPKQKKLFQRISDHVAKHGWFYGAIVQLLGTATMTMLA